MDTSWKKASRWSRYIAYRRYTSAVGWIAIAGAAVIAIVLGTFGFQKHLAASEPQNKYSYTTLVFMCLQLFSLNSGAVAEPVGWQLETARALAVLATGGTLFKTLAAVFRRQIKLLRLRLTVGHVVLCGLGKKGRQLAEDLVAAGYYVVAIERDASGESSEYADLVLPAQADDAFALSSAGVHRAACLIAACGRDDTNLRIGSLAAELCLRQRKRSLPPLECQLHVTDVAMFRLLHDCHRNVATKGIVDLRRFDALFQTARSLFDEHPLDRAAIEANSSMSVRLVLLGSHQVAQCLLLQAARLGHFANGRRLQVVVVDPNIADFKRNVLSRWPLMGQVCDVEFVQSEVDDPDVHAKLDRWALDENCLNTVVVAIGDEGRSLSTALRLPNTLRLRAVPIFIYLPEDRGLSELLLRDDEGTTNLRPFGGQRDACSARVVLQQSLDRLARAIHDDYVRRRSEQGHGRDQFPAMTPWEELDEGYKESNRHQADHIPVKLRAFRCRAMSEQAMPVDKCAELTAEEVEMLAKVEHERWCANRLLDGWQFGPRDDERRRHPDLVPWDQLSEPTRDYDRDAVRQIPHLLGLIGEVLVRESA